MAKDPKGGVLNAAKLLSSMPKEQRDVVVKEMLARDPSLAELIKMHMVSFDDLKHLTPMMMQSFLKQIKIEDLALSLKIANEDVKQFFLDNVSKGMKREITDILDGPKKKLSEVNEAHDRIMTIVRDLVDKGELVLSSSDDEYV